MPKKNQPGCPCGCGQQNKCCQVACKPCAIPQKDLNISWTSANNCSGSATLTYANGTWTSGCILLTRCGESLGPTATLSLSCFQGKINAYITLYSQVDCAGIPVGQNPVCAVENPFNATGYLFITSLQCTPFQMALNCNGGLPLGTRCQDVLPLLDYNFTISDPDPNPPPLMCQTFTVLACTHYGIPGALVSVYQSQGGSLVASGLTNSSGILHLTWQGSPGPYYITASAAGYPSQSGTNNLACGGGTIFALVVPHAQECCDGCSVPPLTLTDANGSYPLTKDPESGSWFTDLVPVRGVKTAAYTQPQTPCNNCQTCVINESGGTYVQYQVTCQADGSYVVQRFWADVCYTTDIFCSTGYVFFCWSGNGPFPVPAACEGILSCGDIDGISSAYWDGSTWPGINPSCGGTGQSVGTMTPTCYPFSMSGDLASLGGGLGDPVGGGVVIDATNP